MKTFEQAFNVFWLLLGGGVCTHAVQLGLWSSSGPDSGFFPLLAGSAIVGLAIPLFVRTARQASEARRFRPERAAARRVYLVTGGLVALVLMIPYLGFLLSGAISTAFFLRILEKTRWPVVLTISGTSAVLVYWLFVRLLGTPLPTGPFGF